MSIDFADTHFAIAITGVILSIATALLAPVRDFRSFAYRAFALGMLAFAAETIFFLFGLEAIRSHEAVAWAKWRLTASAFLPGCWLLFSLSYARENYREFIAKWKWTVFASFALTLPLVSLGRDYLFSGSAFMSSDGNWIIPLGWSGYIFYICFLLSSVLILANLEKTLRSSSGKIRWQIKFSLIGIGALFAARIYTSTQILLFSSLDTQLLTINSSVLVVANILVIFSAIRNRLQLVSIYVSQDLLYSSITILMVGLYLLVVGIVTKIVVYLGISDILFQNAFIAFLALVGLVILLCSEHMRYKIRKFVHHHFRRPYYDYRKIWTDFTQKTASHIDIRYLCTAVAKTVSQTFLSSAVSIWLLEEDLNHPVLVASTALSLSQTNEVEKELIVLAAKMSDQREPVDLSHAEWDVLPHISKEFLEKVRIRYCAPLVAGGEFVGFLTVNSPTGLPFSIEEFDLLKTLADQAAGLILNHKLFENLGRAKEMQAFQTLSAFFVHDLKNVASTLSLTLQNMPVHYDNPEFRSDALKTISNSVAKIQKMCGQLSLLDQKFELQKSECDLNELITSTLSTLSLNGSVVTDLKPLPKCYLDPEQVRKVILNMILNASESGNGKTQIRIETCLDGDNLLFSVTDNGSGMSREFIKKSLFHPFRTTKARGSGIGLYQSKMIVEAHGGRIEVQSQEGCGSTFRVILPLKSEAKSPRD
jgi:putative PEP-CTERM system histidine kinase